MRTTDTDDTNEHEQKKYYDHDRIEIEVGDPRKDFWLSGYVKNDPSFTFEAKVFDVGGEHGIDGGRISKLSLYKDGEEVTAFDRGWWTDESAEEADPSINQAISEIKAAFSKDVEHVETAEQERAVEVPQQPIEAVADSRPVNPMGFFKDKPRDWASRAATVERPIVPNSDRSDDNDYGQER